MKKYIVLLLLIGGCSSSVEIFIDKELDFNVDRYNSYSWKDAAADGAVDIAMYDQVLTEKRVRHAVDSVMEKKGYHLGGPMAALQLHYHIIIENNALSPTEPYDYETNTYWVRTETDSYEYEDGTLIIDVVDAASGYLVWRSRAVAILYDLHCGDVQRRLNKAAAKMLKALPPASRPAIRPVQGDHVMVSK
jgi:hypothetical protein